MNRRIQLAALAASGALLLAGCGSGGGGTTSSADSSASTQAASPSAAASPSDAASDSPSAAPSPDAVAAVITIKDYEYKVPATVAPGTKVMIKNEDSVAHTVTADKGAAFDVTIAAGKTAELTAPDQAGSFPFHCTFHSNMEATLKVG